MDKREYSSFHFLLKSQIFIILKLGGIEWNENRFNENEVFTIIMISLLLVLYIYILYNNFLLLLLLYENNKKIVTNDNFLPIYKRRGGNPPLWECGFDLQDLQNIRMCEFKLEFLSYIKK